MGKYLLVALFVCGACGLMPATANASGGSSYVRLRCTVPSTSSLSRAIRQQIETDLSQNGDYVHVRTSVRFRRASRLQQELIHVEEAFQGTSLTHEGSLQYRLSGAPELLHCTVAYDVTIKVTVTQYVESFDDVGYDPYGYGGGYGYGDECGYGNYCRYHRETFSESATSRIELEGILG